MRRLLICTASVLLCAAELTGQESGVDKGPETALVAGQRIRVELSGYKQRLIGEFAGLVNDSLVLSIEGQVAPLAIDAKQVNQLEVSRQGTLAGLGTAIGIAGGLVGGIAIYANNKEDCPKGDDLCRLGDIDDFLVIPGMILAGGLVGNLIGRLFKSEVWEPLPVEELHIGFGSSPQRADFAIWARLDL